jgi:hypothetical protein
MAFQGGLNPWEIGTRLIAVTGRTLSPCLLTDFVATLLQGDLAEFTSVAPDIAAEPLWSRLPEELTNRAIVGSIGAALRDLALDHYDAYASGKRPRLDASAIRARATQGVADGQRLLVSTLEKAVTDLAYLRVQLEAGLRPWPPESIPVPVDSIGIRVVLERLQFPDASDPALVDGRLTMTARVRLDGSVIATRIIEGLIIPAFDARGSFVELSSHVGETVVQSGERLTIELLVGAWELEEVANDLVRFAATQDGDPSTWLGRHSPDRAQPWRLWYRIERAGGGD